MITDFNAEQIQIDKSFVSIFASGLSIDGYSQEDLDYIKERSYMVGTNYFLKKYTPDLLIWADPKSTTFMQKEGYLEFSNKKCLYMSRPEAFKKRKVTEAALESTQVDYWFTKTHYKLIGNYTAIWILQLIYKFHPDKTILLFGFDFDYNPGDDNVKYYDRLINYDKESRQPNYTSSLLSEFRKYLENWVKAKPERKERVFNCNPQSKTDCLVKVNFKEILK